MYIYALLYVQSVILYLRYTYHNCNVPTTVEVPDRVDTSWDSLLLQLSPLTLLLPDSMEQILSSWLRVRTWFRDKNEDPSDYHEHGKHKSTTSNKHKNRVRKATILVGKIFWNSIEWIVAWILIVAFSGWYLWEYSTLKIHQHLSRRTTSTITISNNDDSDTNNHNPIMVLPATCLEQTTIQQSVQYWEDLWEDMKRIIQEHHQQDDEEESLIRHLRSNRHARHVASLLLCKDINNKTTKATTRNEQQEQQESIRRILIRIWPLILALPSDAELHPPAVPDTNATRDTITTAEHELHHHQIQENFDISLIIPAFQVSLEEINHLLQYTLDRCLSPQKIQVIVAEAFNRSPVGPIAKGLSDGMLLGGIQKNGGHPSVQGGFFGTIQVVSYTGTRGRGGCLNFGAQYASGKIFTFLHSDTYLPGHWDESIRKALLGSNHSSCCNRNNKHTTITTMCAFSMGIDVSPFQSGHVPAPVGLWGADYILGTIRCSLCKLPYGDSALSLPSHIFHYLGGYPDQPLMEDFELVQLLRKRATLMPSLTPNNPVMERITILPDRIACSPRRWQHYGVAYVILANAYCIYKYRRLQVPAEEIFEFYYGRTSHPAAKQ